MPRAFVRTLIRKLLRDRRGNVLMIMGFAIIPITYATGMVVDYSRAARLQTKLNAAADAAALAGVTQPMMSKTDAEAKAAAIAMFNEQVTGLPGLTNVVLTVPDPVSTSGASNSRTVTVSYTAKSVNAFGGVLGMSTITIGGSSVANASTAPNIDFYILLDTSGSMALPATSAGLSLLTSKTGGCAFACHSTNDKTAKDANNKTTDYYGVATSYNIPLRVDEAKKGIQGMMTLATNTSSTNKAKYRAALASFAAADTRANNSYKSLQGLTDTLSKVATAAGNAETSLYYSNGNPTSTYGNNDTDTASSDAFNKINKVMPIAGNGTNLLTDTPQTILFLITDGMRDESRPGGKPEVKFDTAWCDTVKAKGARIAVLYTEYLPESIKNDTWSNDSTQGDIANRLKLIEPALQACSSSGLYYKVTTDDDISAALNLLFQKVVATAHLTQ